MSRLYLVLVCHQIDLHPRISWSTTCWNKLSVQYNKKMLLFEVNINNQLINFHAQCNEKSLTELVIKFNNKYRSFFKLWTHQRIFNKFWTVQISLRSFNIARCKLCAIQTCLLLKVLFYYSHMDVKIDFPCALRLNGVFWVSQEPIKPLNIYFVAPLP